MWYSIDSGNNRKLVPILYSVPVHHNLAAHGILEISLESCSGFVQARFTEALVVNEVWTDTHLTVDPAISASTSISQRTTA